MARLIGMVLHTPYARDKMRGNDAALVRATANSEGQITKRPVAQDFTTGEEDIEIDEAMRGSLAYFAYRY